MLIALKIRKNNAQRLKIQKQAANPEIAIRLALKIIQENHPGHKIIISRQQTTNQRQFEGAQRSNRQVIRGELQTYSRGVAANRAGGGGSGQQS